jgi:hypothetical protein
MTVAAALDRDDCGLSPSSLRSCRDSEAARRAAGFAQCQRFLLFQLHVSVPQFDEYHSSVYSFTSRHQSVRRDGRGGPGPTARSGAAGPDQGSRRRLSKMHQEESTRLTFVPVEGILELFQSSDNILRLPYSSRPEWQKHFCRTTQDRQVLLMNTSISCFCDVSSFESEATRSIAQHNTLINEFNIMNVIQCRSNSCLQSHKCAFLNLIIQII